MIYHMEKKDTNKNQENFEYIQTNDMAAAIKVIKEVDPKNDNKSLDVEDIIVASE